MSGYSLPKEKNPFNYSSLTFSGDGVDVPGLGNAAFPLFTDKEKSVTNWVDGAHTGWDMNRFEDGRGCISK